MRIRNTPENGSAPPAMAGRNQTTLSLNELIAEIDSETALPFDPNAKKEEIGKALSTFYDCRFVGYDASMPFAHDIFTYCGFDKSELLKECWVPLNWDEKNGVEVIVDDPLDSVKAVKIKASLQTDKVFFAVGIKEDIEAFVNLFFDQLQVINFNFEEISNGKCEKVTNSEARSSTWDVGLIFLSLWKGRSS